MLLYRVEFVVIEMKVWRNWEIENLQTLENENWGREER